MLKRIKQIKNKRLIVADALLVAALVIAFAVTYDISKHAGLYLLSGEMLVAAVMLVRSGKGKVYCKDTKECYDGVNLVAVKSEACVNNSIAVDRIRISRSNKVYFFDNYISSNCFIGNIITEIVKVNSEVIV